MLVAATHSAARLLRKQVGCILICTAFRTLQISFDQVQRTVVCNSIETSFRMLFFSGGADAATMVNNVVDGFQYTETQIGTASDFKAWIKDYMNAVVLKLRDKKKAKEDIQAFKATAPGIAKFFLSQFSDVQFFLTASFNAETMVFSIYPEGALTPNFYYIMGGLAAEKF